MKKYFTNHVGAVNVTVPTSFLRKDLAEAAQKNTNVNSSTEQRIGGSAKHAFAGAK